MKKYIKLNIIMLFWAMQKFTKRIGTFREKNIEMPELGFHFSRLKGMSMYRVVVVVVVVV